MDHTNRRPTLSPIGQAFLFEVEGRKGGTYYTESEILPRGKDLFLADALAGAKQEDDLVAVWQINPDEGSMRDVSEDVARAWMNELLADRSSGFDPEDAATWPQFISRHITNDEACRARVAA